MRGHPSARKWLDKALEDLTVADRCMWPPCMPALACFHAQQAAEKALKAVAVSSGVLSVPKSHDLLEIAKVIEEHGTYVPFPPSQLASLIPYAVQARYPLDSEPSELAAADALGLAERIAK